MSELAAGLLVVLVVVAAMSLFIGVGVLAGLIVCRLIHGKYVDPTKVRICRDIRDD